MLVELITFPAPIGGWEIDVLRHVLECGEISSTSLSVLPLIPVLIGSCQALSVLPLIPVLIGLCQAHPRVYDSGARRSTFRHSLPLEQLLAVACLTVKMDRRPNVNHQH